MKPTAKSAKLARPAKEKPLKKTIVGKAPTAAHATSKKSIQKWAKVSLDEFINSGSENDSVEDNEDEGDLSDEEQVTNDSGGDEEGGDESGEEDDSDDGGDSENEGGVDTAKKHKKTLEKLKESDPEFYQFLSENDKDLLEFDTSDSDDEDGGSVHKPPEELEEASDDSDFEDKDSTEKRQANTITQAMVDEWQVQLQSAKCIKTVTTVVQAFRSAVQSVSEEKSVPTKFKVQGGTAFNAVVRLCIVDLIPALKRILKTPEDEKLNLERCKSWVKIRTQVKLYLTDVIRLMGTLTETSLLSVLLKHIHQLIPFYSAFAKISKILCKKLVAVWCSSEDTIRVLAFLSLLRLARTQPSKLLEIIIKAMYLSYARNCKFTSPSTWPVINFMRRSLVEILALQETVTYRHAFLYIRQLAIHLRNAVTLKKKDSIATVYNWQFVHCLHLWAALHGAVPDSQLLKPLIYPLVQIAIGTINLVPTGRYYPLRFHVVSILNQLTSSTGVFVPVVPFLLEILQNHRFEKKPSKVSMKPLDLSCILRVSQSQLAESGYRDAIVELLYDRLLETLQCQSHLAAFPELALPVIVQLRQFVKKCPLANYTKKMKQLLDKIQETVIFVEKQRGHVSFDLTDTKAVTVMENQIKASGTPLTTYHSSWKKIRDREMAIKIAKRPEMDREDKMPFLKKSEAKPKGDGDQEDAEFDGLFPSDLSEDDEQDDTTRFLTKEERNLKRKTEPETSKPAKKAKAVKDVQSSPAASETTVKSKKKKPEVVQDDPDDIDDEVHDFDMSDEDEQELVNEESDDDENNDDDDDEESDD